MTEKRKTDALVGWGTGTMENEGGGEERSSLLEVSDRKNGWCNTKRSVDQLATTNTSLTSEERRCTYLDVLSVIL